MVLAAVRGSYRDLRQRGKTRRGSRLVMAGLSRPSRSLSTAPSRSGSPGQARRWRHKFCPSYWSTP